MFLKTLELHGFKSFADKTKLEFHEGVTGIVGPNGCGKSNIVDAVRWVLGETSAKALRGGEMADVIFNGTDRRAQLGMAEVVLTLAGCAEALDTEFDEVAIGRRVYRDGKSEYLINNSPCRLKDVHELLMGTGIGRTSYSIMEQGKIDMLLSSKPEDRRAVFEEAAGITRFKAQKKEALRKLDYTEANLLRVRDIIAEEERQIRSLARQASKARRFQNLQEEVRVLDLHYSHRQWRELLAMQSEMSESSQLLRQEQSALEDEIEHRQAEMASARFQHQELEGRISELQASISSLQNEIESAVNRIHFNGERAHEQSILIGKNESDIEESSHKLALQQEELAMATETLNTVEERLQSQEEILRKYEEERGEAIEAREALVGELRHAEREKSRFQSEVASLTARLAANSLQFDTDKERLLELTDELGELRREEERKNGEAAELRILVDEHKAAIVRDEEEFEGMVRRYRNAKENALARFEELSGLHKMNAEKVSRLDVLEQLVAEGEGFAKGTQAVLKGFEDSDLLEGTERKPLYAFLETEDLFAGAIEAALGNQLQTVVIDGLEVAERVIEALKEGMLGKASLIAADHLRRTAGRERRELPPGAVIWALDAVRPDEVVRPLMDQLLGDVVITESLRSGLELRGNHPQLAVATLEGDYISREGVIHGGASGDDSGSFLKRQTEIRDLSRLTQSLNEEVQKMQKRRDELSERVSRLEGSLDEARQKLQEKKVYASNLDGQLRLVENERNALVNRIENIKREEEQIRQRGVGLEESMVGHRAELEESNAGIAEMDLRIDRASSRLEAAREREDELNRLVQDVRTGLAVEKGTLENLQNQRIPMANRLAELEQLIVRRREETDDFRERIRRGEAESAELRQRIETKTAERAEQVEARDRLQEQRSAFIARIEAGEEELTRKRKKVQEVAEKRNREELQVSQCEIHIDNLLKNTRERYRTDLEGFEPDSHQFLAVIDEQKRARSYGGGDSESGEGNEEFSEQAEPDWAFVEEVVGALRSKLDSMGPVNLDAISEYEELEERYQFNLRELKDLENAKEELLKLIARINRDTRKMFSETFAQVRTNFREMFKELFGEKAQSDLVLLDDEDPLEAGIEVIAKPPGKKLQSISLLSGGERSMTAVALLFAIFMVKPSPFCVLDELDAPLDEANIARFIRVLDRFIGKSQFIIVTHSKRTMSRADVMYGVSMEEFGVSKTVGVKFSRAEEAIGLRPAPVGG